MVGFYILMFIVGAGVGSFLNVIILRLPDKISVWKGRSQCPRCKAILRPKELVPLLSFLILRGRCHHCHKRISGQYPLVEFITAGLFVFFAWQLADAAWLNPIFYRNLIFVCALVVIFFTDLRFYLILDAVVLPLMVVALAFNLFLGAEAWLNTLWGLLLAAAIAGLFFALQHWWSKGQWLGSGDIRLGILMGLMLGWPGVLVALVLAYVLGAVGSMGLILIKRKTLQDHIPLGVFLTLATLITLVWGEPILRWYLNLLR